MPVFEKPLSGQNVLVTGASGAIGAAIVERLVEEGARPIIHYGRDRAAAAALLERIAERGVLVQADLSKSTGAFDLWRMSVEKVGRIHALINNAGIRSEIAIDSDVDLWRSAWQREFQINVFAAADLCREAIKHFRSEGGGRIVNMTSRAGQRGYAAEAMPYGATKAALVNLTKSIARSFGGDGIVAVAIAPGWVETEMAEQFIAQFGKQAAVSDIPIGEMAQPSEIAELVAFALRPSQRSLNGATLDVNGGSYIR
jgi:NAD(P)-dependent dehydrogenase (short-subunit alcohol dehydrogenase family)